jgi:hypothetical protein
VKLQLPNSISSSQDLNSMRLELREYAKWFSHNEIKKRVGAHNPSEQPELSPAARDTLQAWKAENPITSHSLDELQHALEQLEKSAPHVTLTLAAPATGDLRKNLIDWCRHNIAPNVMVDFRFNSTLLGGMVVRYGSHIFDWSFRRQIMTSLDKFPGILRNV